MSDDAYNEAVMRWYDAIPVHQRDQFDTYVREAARLIRKLAPIIEEYERAGYEAAERYANGDDT